MDASPEMERLKRENVELKKENQRLTFLLNNLTTRIGVTESRLADHATRLNRIEVKLGIEK